MKIRSKNSEEIPLRMTANTEREGHRAETNTIDTMKEVVAPTTSMIRIGNLHQDLITEKETEIEIKIAEVMEIAKIERSAWTKTDALKDQIEMRSLIPTEEQVRVRPTTVIETEIISAEIMIDIGTLHQVKITQNQVIPIPRNLQIPTQASHLNIIQKKKILCVKKKLQDLPSLKIQSVHHQNQQIVNKSPAPSPKYNLNLTKMPRNPHLLHQNHHVMWFKPHPVKKTK